MRLGLGAFRRYGALHAQGGMHGPIVITLALTLTLTLNPKPSTLTLTLTLILIVTLTLTLSLSLSLTRFTTRLLSTRSLPPSLNCMPDYPSLHAFVCGNMTLSPPV